MKLKEETVMQSGASVMRNKNPGSQRELSLKRLVFRTAREEEQFWSSCETGGTFIRPVDRSYAIISANLDKYRILAEIAPNNFNLIDGQHRMEKARRMGIEKIKAYKVNAIYLPDFIIIKKGYLAFVDYWNEKLKAYNKYLKRTGK